MKITAQEEYGLRCLLRLARADGHSLTIPEIAAVEGLSSPYVAKILAVLRQAGLIESVRGRAGGYRLAKSPAEIGLGSVLMSIRSEEHTSELQSLTNLVCRLLLEKKKNTLNQQIITIMSSYCPVVGAAPQTHMHTM